MILPVGASSFREAMCIGAEAKTGFWRDGTTDGTMKNNNTSGSYWVMLLLINPSMLMYNQYPMNRLNNEGEERVKVV